MNISMSKSFYEARNAYRAAEDEYKTRRAATRTALVASLPTCGDGVTAAELEAQSGINSHDIADLLRRNSYGRKAVHKTYVLLQEDGTVDYDHKIVKRYKVNTYRR